MFKQVNVRNAIVFGLAFAQFTAPQMAMAEEHAVRGVISAADELAVSSDVVAMISDLPWKAGDVVQKGDLLVAFDCDRQSAQLNAARAEAAAAGRAASQQRELFSYGATGRLDLDVAQAEAASAAARAAAVEASLKTCEVAAPFDGRIADVRANAHETAEPGVEILRVISDGELEIKMIIPSKWLRWVRVGAAFDFTVDETGLTHRAEIVRMGARVDPVSQTITVVGRFQETGAFILDGMSGSAAFDAPETVAVAQTN